MVQICLNRETMHGLKYRSVMCPGEENLKRIWRMVSAVVSPCGRYIATTFFDHSIRLLRTVLWLVRTDDISKTTDTWAEVKIIDDVNLKGNPEIVSRKPCFIFTSFWDEDIFITLGGIWSIKQEETIGRPANIFQLESIRDICLSKDRVARVKGRNLEVLELCIENDEFEARLVMETDLDTELETEWEKTKSESWQGKETAGVQRPRCETSLLQFSASAQKLVVGAFGRKIRCLILEGPSIIRVDLASPTHGRVLTAVFTADESSIIGCIRGSGIPFHKTAVGVWTIKQQNGQYCENADILYLFQSGGSDFDFIYFPGTVRKNEGIIIVTTAGEVIQRDLSTKPLIPLYEIPEKPQSILTAGFGAYSVDCKIIKQGSCIRFNRMILETNNRTFRDAFFSEIWCISKALVKLSFFELPPLPNAYSKSDLRFSPLGQYIITDYNLFHYADGALSNPIQLPENSQYISVSPDDKIITCMTFNGGAAVFHMLQAREAQSPLVAATYELKNWRDLDRPDGEVDLFASTFHDTAPHLILLSYKLSYKNTDTESAFTVALKYDFDHFQSFLVTGIFLPYVASRRPS